MYKGASRAMQHAHGVDRPHPSRGYIDNGPDAADVLPDVSVLTIEQLRTEQNQLRSELTQAEQGIAIAKLSGIKSEREHAGQKKVVITSRLSVVNKAITAINADSELGRLKRAIRDVAGHEMAELIFASANEIPVITPPASPTT